MAPLRSAPIVALAIAITPSIAAAHPLDDLAAGHWLEVPDSHLRDVAASPDEFPWVGQGEGISGIVNDWCSGAYDTTRDRLYIDAMQQIYGNVTKILVESRQGQNMLFLPLDKIMQQVAAGGAAAAVDPAPVAPPAGTPPAASSDARNRDNARSRERESR